MKGKKIISCVLAVMLSLGTITLLPAKIGSNLDIAVTADAASDFQIETDEDGDKYIAGYSGKGGDITIPKSVSYIGENAFSGNDKIKSVTFEKNAYIWSGAFEGCVNLKKVVINGNASFGNEAFAYCVNLASVEVNGSIVKCIAADAFSNCHALKSFTVKKDRYDYWIGGCAFFNCINLRTVDITEGCTELYADVFTNCVNLTSVTIPAKTKFIYKNGKNQIGYSYGSLSNDTSEKYEYRIADNSTSVYIFTYSTRKTNDSLYYVDTSDPYVTDKFDLIGNYTYCKPKKVTLNITKGSSAEEYAKKYGIAYKFVSAAVDKLAEPTGFKASSKTKTTITLTWNKVKGADAYEVYMYNSNSGKYEKYKTVKGNSCVVDDLTKNTKYKFKVAALDKVNGKYVTGEKSDPISVTTSK